MEESKLEEVKEELPPMEDPTDELCESIGESNKMFKFFSVGETFKVIEMGKTAIWMNSRTFCTTVYCLTHPR